MQATCIPYSQYDMINEREREREREKERERKERERERERERETATFFSFLTCFLDKEYFG